MRLQNLTIWILNSKVYTISMKALKGFIFFTGNIHNNSQSYYNALSTFTNLLNQLEIMILTIKSCEVSVIGIRSKISLHKTRAQSVPFDIAQLLTVLNLILSNNSVNGMAERFQMQSIKAHHGCTSNIFPFILCKYKCTHKPLENTNSKSINIQS